MMYYDVIGLKVEVTDTKPSKKVKEISDNILKDAKLLPKGSEARTILHMIVGSIEELNTK